MIDNKKLLGNDNDIFQIKEVLEKSLDNKWTQEFVYLLRKFFYIEYWSNVEKNERYTIQMIQEVLKKHLDFLDEDRGTEEVMRKFRAMLPYLQQLVISDMKAAYEGDPAAKSYEEIIAAYPGPLAILIQRTANCLYKLKVPILPRIMTEYAHSITGIDIHPGAEIGESFFIDHVQTAYLMGRNNLFDYGGVACHVYLELKYKKLDVSRVRLVWNKLIQTHDMLRTVVFEEGYQQVLKEVPELEIPYWDVSKGENICEYNDFRQQMGNHVYDTGKWPMFGIAVAKKAEESILYFSMDFLIADWTSIWMLLSEFEALYYLKKDSINVPQITFRDYLSAERKLKESERYVNDKRYWEKRREEKEKYFKKLRYNNQTRLRDLENWPLFDVKNICIDMG